MNSKDISNTPVIPVTFRLLVYPSIALISGVIAYSFENDLLVAFITGLISVAALVLLRVTIRLLAFLRFLKTIGKEAEWSEHNIDLSILGVVPFSGKGAALVAAPTQDGVLLKRSGICRFIDWDKVVGVRDVNFLEKPVLEITFLERENVQRCSVPWSIEANAFIPEVLR